MTDEVGRAIAQTSYDAQQVGGTGQGATVPPTPSTPPLPGQNGHVNDGGLARPDVVPSGVVTIPTGGVTWGRKSTWMEMPDEYAGMKVRVWVNYPNDFDNQMSSKDSKIIRDAAKQIFLEHNGWVTPEEYELAQKENRTPRPMPQPTTDEFWELVPNELAGALLLLLNRETLKLPNSLMKKNRSLMTGQ